MESNIKGKVLSGLFWKLLERWGTQGIQLFTQIYIARLLLPEDYGIISLIAIFISIADVFVESGFNSALIQKKEVDDLDFSSVFYTSIAMAGALYLVVFVSAPLIAGFYKEPLIKDVLRVLSINLFFNALYSVQNAVISRKMHFKRFFFSSLGAITTSGVVGILMAAAGYGVWALVAQQISFNLIIITILWFTVKWRPKLSFSFGRIKILFGFGKKLLLSALLETAYKNVYGLIIGKRYNSQMLGYYHKGGHFPDIIVSNISSAISSVLFPTLSANQENIARIKTLLRRSISTSSFIIFPAMTGLAICAEPLIKILLTDKWLPSVPFMQIICLSYAFSPINAANAQAINSIGRSDVILKLEMINKTIGILLLLISIPFGIYVMVALKSINSIIGALINSGPLKRLLTYNYKEQWDDLWPLMLLSAVMGIIIYCVKFFYLSGITTLAIQVVTGMIVYILLAYVLKIGCLTYLLSIIKELLNKWKNRKYKEEVKFL